MNEEAMTSVAVGESVWVTSRVYSYAINEERIRTSGDAPEVLRRKLLCR